MNEALKQYETEPIGFWQNTWMLGDGYDVMGRAAVSDWHAIGGWGIPGYELGSWPYTIVFFKEKDGKFLLISYSEGEVTMYTCPTEEIRNQITDEIAFSYWKQGKESWVEGIETVDALPEELRGPERD